MPERTLSESEYNAIKAHVLDATPDGLKEADFNRYVGPAFASAIGEAENSAAPLEGSAIARFAAGAWKNLNPMGLVEAVKHPIDTVTGLVNAQGTEFSKFNTAAKEGRDVEALGHLAAGIVPVLGPAAAHAGERIGSGDIAGGMGEGAGLVGAVETPRAIKLVRKGVNTVATKVAESPGTQQAIGATTGAVTGGATGHPYIGLAIGSKYGAPLVKSVAEGVQAVTGGAPPPTVAAVLSDLDVARQEVAAGRLPKSVLDTMERRTPLPARAPMSAPTLSLDERMAAAKAARAAAQAPSAPPQPVSAPVSAPAPAPAQPMAAAPVAAPTPASPTAAVPQTPAAIASRIFQAAQRAKVRLSPDDNIAAFQAVKSGMTPETAIQTIVQKRFTAAMPGTMTPEQVAAEIAARVGNRSPVRP